MHTRRRKVPKRDDRSHGHTYYSCAAHLHRFEGLASGFVAGVRDLYHSWCKQECDKSKARCKAATSNSTYGGATIESVLGSCGDRCGRYWARCKVEFACTCEHSVYRALVPAVEWTGSTGVCPVWPCWEREGERTRQTPGKSSVHQSREN